MGRPYTECEYRWAERVVSFMWFGIGVFAGSAFTAIYLAQ